MHFCCHLPAHVSTIIYKISGFLSNAIKSSCSSNILITCAHYKSTCLHLKILERSDRFQIKVDILQQLVFHPMWLMSRIDNWPRFLALLTDWKNFKQNTSYCKQNFLCMTFDQYFNRNCIIWRNVWHVKPVAVWHLADFELKAGSLSKWLIFQILKTYLVFIF